MTAVEELWGWWGLSSPSGSSEHSSTASSCSPCAPAPWHMGTRASTAPPARGTPRGTVPTGLRARGYLGVGLLSLPL